MLIGFVPPAAAQFDPPQLSVMTYNVLATNDDIDAIAQTIRASDADVVVLQEISQRIAQRLPRALADDYAYSSLHPSPVSRLGLGVYSRFPLISDDYLAYQTQSSRLRLQINIKGLLVTIYNVHLANPLTNQTVDPQAHSEGITGLLDMLASEYNPLIVAGDFNMTDFSTDYGRMAERLVDSFHESGTGLGNTYPSWSPLPLARLDYVFHSSDMTSLTTQVMPSAGSSDHFPVRAELAFQGS